MLESVKFLDQCFCILLLIVVIIFLKIYICDTFYAVNICFFNNCAIKRYGDYLVFVKETTTQRSFFGFHRCGQ